MQTSARPCPRLRGRAAAWLLLAAMLFAPWLAQVHGGLHGTAQRAAGAPMGAQPLMPGAGAGKATNGLLERLFGNHDHPTDCRLYDQLGHADLISGVPAPCLPVLPPAVLTAFLTGEAVARFAALFDARGPPPVR